jgi:flagellar hook protein FlgE
MSLLGALNSAVSALSAQSQAIAMISDNLANSSTTGYKTTTASFESMVTASASATSYSSGGVTASARADISAQGLLTTSSSGTSIAISGNGFFPVRDGTSGSAVYYTRNGEFTVNSQGYLTNGSYNLLGWPTDASGNVPGGETAGGLEPINTNAVSSISSPTTTASLQATLPADAAVGDTFTSTMEVYDSLGTAANTTVTWTKTAANQWAAGFSNPTLASDSSVQAGTVTSSDVTVNFNADGTLASTSPASPTLTIGSWTTGASSSSIALNMGTANKADGLSQYTTGASSVSLQVSQDGVAYSKLTGVKVDDNGNVMASYDNGQSRAIYKVPVATFNNPDGLTATDGGIYTETSDSGTAVLHESGEGGAGTVEGGKLEESTTDTSAEFSKMIAAQQAYSASAQVITAVNKMFDTLVSAAR